MKRTISINPTKPQYITVTNLSYAQIDYWFGHARIDLKLDIIFPEEHTEKKYPCIVWICGGGWLSMDKSVHMAYLSKLALEGFVVASVQYRTSNEASYPSQIQDVKAGIRYLKAHSERYHIDIERIGIMGDSAGGYLTAMAAFDNDKSLDVGAYLDYSSEVKAACMWYPPTNLAEFMNTNPTSPEKLMLGAELSNKKSALESSPVNFVRENLPASLIIHGTNDNTVPFSQGEELYEKLNSFGNDVELIAIDGADHADEHFFQDEIWSEILLFFKKKL